MKAEIHPTYHAKATVKCACGNTFEIGSTKESIEVEVCSACHPFYVGDDKKKVLAGRLEKFKQRQTKASEKQEIAKKQAAAKKAKKTSKKDSDESEG